MPPAAWSGQWVSNAGGHQSRDLNPVFIAGKRLFADRDKWRQNPPTGSANRSRRPTALLLSYIPKSGHRPSALEMSALSSAALRLHEPAAALQALGRPDCVEIVGLKALDLNRLIREVDMKMTRSDAKRGSPSTVW